MEKIQIAIQDETFSKRNENSKQKETNVWKLLNSYFQDKKGVLKLAGCQKEESVNREYLQGSRQNPGLQKTLYGSTFEKHLPEMAEIIDF